MTDTRARAVATIGLLILLGLTLRVVHVVRLPNELVFGDASDYWSCSENLVQGNGFSLQPTDDRLAHVPPLYPLVLAAWKAFGIDSLLQVRLAQAVLSVCLIPLVFWLGAGLFPRRVLIAGLTVYAVSPHMIFWSGLVATETLAVLLFSLSLFGFLHGLQRRNTALQLVSFPLLGLAVLTRSVFILVPPIYLLAMVRRDRRWLWQAAAGAGLFLLTLAPWMLRNYALFDHLVPVTIGTGRMQIYRLQGLSGEIQETLAPREAHIRQQEQRYLHPESAADEYEADRELRIVAAEAMKAHPRAMARLSVYNLLRFWSPGATLFAERIRWERFLPSFAVGGLLFPFAAYGLVGLFRRNRRAFWVSVLVLLYFTAVHMPLVGMLRYRVPLEVLLYCIAALGAFDLWDRLRRRGRLGSPVD